MKHFLFCVSAVAGCLSISAFDCLPGIPRGITSSAKEFKIYVISTGMNWYK